LNIVSNLDKIRVGSAPDQICQAEDNQMENYYTFNIFLNFYEICYFVKNWIKKKIEILMNFAYKFEISSQD
jgi:hypothetical protein